MLAHFDCPTGIAGDMCLGALVDAGVPFDYLQDSLAQLGLTAEYDLTVETVQRQGQAATQVKVGLKTAPGHRHWPQIEQMITAAQFSESVTQQSLAIFRQLAIAEAAVHGIPPERVHFHEVGATDALVDIVGTCLGLDWLGVTAVSCSALPVGGGTVRAAHGRLPVPAPAVLKLLTLAKVPIYSNGIQRELVTPTGAAIATTLAQQFGDPPPMILHQVGLGAGNHDLPIPNLLRLWLGQPTDPAHPRPQPKQPAAISEPTQASSPKHPSPPVHHSHHSPSAAADAQPHEDPNAPLIDQITVLQTQLDDLNPQILGYLYDPLYAAGAVEIFTQGITMKKSRPGILLTVLCPASQVAACETVIFAETSTLGIRRWVQPRHILHREFQTVTTPYGPVAIKIGRANADGPILNVQPEYEDCARLAQTHQQPWQHIHQQALWTWQQQQPQAVPTGLEFDSTQAAGVQR